jgi:hypothetical protein
MDALTDKLLGGARRGRTRVRSFAPWRPAPDTLALLDLIRAVGTAIAISASWFAHQCRSRRNRKRGRAGACHEPRQITANGEMRERN